MKVVERTDSRHNDVERYSDFDTSSDNEDNYANISEVNQLVKSEYYMRAECWNCNRSEHGHWECPKPRMRIYCFECGELGVTSKICKNIHIDQNSKSNNRNVRMVLDKKRQTRNGKTNERQNRAIACSYNPWLQRSLVMKKLQMTS